jgi:DnaD/phage-associated family protein
MSEERFDGFPAIGKATAIPNAFFSLVLPKLSTPGALLAFLWVSKLTQEQRKEIRFVSEPELAAHPGVTASFAALAGDCSLASALASCTSAGALIWLEVVGTEGSEALYFVNNPPSRRAVARARAGELQLVPATTVVPAPLASERPGIFRLYEEHIGTITPMVGDRLIEAESTYPREWIEQAFREAAELNARNWRYIERILSRWAEEGRANETAGRDPLEEQKQRFLGGNLGHIVRYR